MEQVTECIIELLITVVADLQQTILYAKSVGIVVTQLVIANLRLPAGQVLAVKQLDPFLFLRGIASGRGAGIAGEAYRDQQKGSHSHGTT